VPDLRLRRHDGNGASELLDTLASIYETEYAEEPYEGNPVFSRQAFTERTQRQVSADGFTLLVGSVDDQPAGYVFGYTYGPGQWLPGPCDPPPPEEIVQSAMFFVVELIVRRPFRGNGYARQLMEGLLAGRTEQFATLCAHPQAKARDIYPRWGWQEVCKMSAGAMTFDIMAKRQENKA
jgi:GNAT superfamily N-acetyltransferase